MQITARTPYARGVDTLMYVGDDGTDSSMQDSAALVAKGLNVATIAFAGYKFRKAKGGWRTFWGALAAWNAFVLAKPYL